MAETIRIQHNRNYTVISNDCIRDSRLSFKARGLLVLLLSYPDGWKVNTEHLTTQSEKDGRTSVLSALKELEQFGYLTRTQIRENGRITGYESVVREIPESGFPQSENLITGNLISENLKTENPLHNKYQFKELPKKEVTREESENALSPSKEDLKNKEVAEQISHTSGLKEGIPGKQINPHEGQGTPAAALKNVYAQAKNVWEMIDTFLLSPDLSDAAIPPDMNLIYREKNKWNGWVWPWRSKTMDKHFQTFNPDVVKKLAADLARKDKATPEQKYSHAIGTLTVWEQSKGGWQKILTLCDRPAENQPEVTPVDIAESDIEIPEGITRWTEAQHQMVHRDYLKSKSIKDFYEMRVYHRAWLKFAKKQYPDWDWTKA